MFIGGVLQIAVNCPQITKKKQERQENTRTHVTLVHHVWK